jgi:hypothetical protein
MSETLLIITTPLRRFLKPVRDRFYLAFLKRFPCVACGSCRLVDAAHFGPHGVATKASDLDALPLCRKCHEEYHRSAVEFAQSKGIDVPALQEFFNRMYETKTGKVLPERRNAA